jgi:hypothetical protein
MVLLVAGMQPAELRGQAIVVSGPEITEAGHERFEFFLDTTGVEGTFDTFELNVTSNGLFHQIGEAGARLDQPSQDSGFLYLLTCPTTFGGHGLSSFGIVDTTSEVSGTYASLGSNSASSQGNYRLAQVVMLPGGGGAFSFAFFDDGQPIGQTGTGISFGVPEPETLALLAVCCLALSGRRR